MDSREAREILSLPIAPAIRIHMDRRMAEALELARRDPQLAVWFGQHCAAHVQLPAEYGSARCARAQNRERLRMPRWTTTSFR